MTSNHCRDSSATDVGPVELQGPNVSSEMLAAALKAVQPFTEEDGVLSTSVMRQALRAALAAALLSEHPADERNPKAFD